jgi:hypothetical protein
MNLHILNTHVLYSSSARAPHVKGCGSVVHLRDAADKVSPGSTPPPGSQYPEPTHTYTHMPAAATPLLCLEGQPTMVATVHQPPAPPAACLTNTQLPQMPSPPGSQHLWKAAVALQHLLLRCGAVHVSPTTTATLGAPGLSMHWMLLMQKARLAADLTLSVSPAPANSCGIRNFPSEGRRTTHNENTPAHSSDTGTGASGSQLSQVQLSSLSLSMNAQHTADGTVAHRSLQSHPPHAELVKDLEQPHWQTGRSDPN